MTVQLATPDNTWLAPSNNPTVAYSNNQVVKTTAGILFGVTVYNSAATPQFIQLHNTFALPGNGAVPVTLLSVPAMGNLSIDFGVHGKAFGRGIVVCNSTTGPTLTIGSNDCWFDPRFK